MPTASQLQKTTEIATKVFADMMGISVVDAITNHKNEIFLLVCAYAAIA